ncbi:MAG: DUF2252 domain-containing protein [Solirubrobacterales bacterium]|nr:DUF2252 domain-containing protein [Solirubrobacterales bacterium]
MATKATKKKTGNAMLSPAERAAKGKEARKAVPRSTHAEWSPGPDRTDPVKVLGDEDVSRVRELVPVRYGRMLDSAFTFYRGSAAIMAGDLGANPDSGLRSQLCGDAHLSNFGIFRAPDRQLVFDINDFDETLPGPFEWDVKRLAASFEIGGRDREFSDRDRRAAVLRSVSSYREAMRQFATMSEAEVWFSRLDVSQIADQLESQVTKADRKRFKKNLAKAGNKTSLRALDRLTEVRDGELRIASRPPVLVPIEELAGRRSEKTVNAAFEKMLGEYRLTLSSDSRALLDRYQYAHAGRKVVGVGSVGTRSWIALLRGAQGDPLFLQFKEAEASVLEPYAGRSKFRLHGKRVVEGQRLMQAASDIALGWITANGADGVKRDFYVRQLWDGKGSAEIESLSSKAMTGYAGLCGWSLARAHARSGDRFAIAAYLGKGVSFDRAIVEYASLYADQNETDFQALLGAVKAGKIKVESNV